MKQTKRIEGFVNFFLLAALLAAFGCSSITDSNDKEESLHVKFINSPSSQYTITSVQLQHMGPADDPAPSGSWGEDIFESGQKLAPGAHAFFDLDIPNKAYCVYRLGVENGDGTELMLHTQQNYSGLEPTITHWGSDERTVEVTVIYDQYSGHIQVSGWSDWAGIE